MVGHVYNQIPLKHFSNLDELITTSQHQGKYIEENIDLHILKMVESIP